MHAAHILFQPLSGDSAFCNGHTTQWSWSGADESGHSFALRAPLIVALQ
jgi:hypothetical protein